MSIHNVSGLQRDYEVYGTFSLLRQWGAWCRSGGQYVHGYRSPAGQVVVDNVEQPKLGWAISDQVAEMIGRIVDDIGTRDKLSGDVLRHRFLDDWAYHKISGAVGVRDRKAMPYIIEGAIGRVDEAINGLIYLRGRATAC